VMDTVDGQVLVAVGNTIWDDIKKKRLPREGNKEVITRIDVPNQTVASVGRSSWVHADTAVAV